MSDKNISLQTADIFGLGSNFGLRRANRNKAQEMIASYGHTAYVVASDSLESRINYSQDAGYCGSALRTDLGALATSFGQVATGGDYNVVLTDLSASWSAGNYTAITLSGHNHESNAHSSMSVTKDISSVIPQDGFGVPDFGITLGSNCSPFSASLTISIEHFDVNDSDRTHIHGENTEKVSCTLDMVFTGVPTTIDEATLETELKTELGVTHITVTSTDLNSGNGNFKSFALSAQFYI